MITKRTIWLVFFFPVLCFVTINTALGQTVSVKNGDVFFATKDGTSRRLTTFGLDSQPSLSFAGDKVVFVRRTPDLKIETGLPGPDGECCHTENELWVANTLGTTKPRRILRGHPGTFKIGPELVLAGFSSPRFSLDESLVFFEAQTWATDSAIYAVDVRSGSPKLLYVGGGFEVIRTGRYKGYLIGSKELTDVPTAHVYWLLGPDGRLLHQIGNGGGTAVIEFKKQNGIDG